MAQQVRGLLPNRGLEFESPGPVWQKGKVKANTTSPGKSYDPFSISLCFRVGGDGNSISKGRISSLKARVRYIFWGSYFVTWQ